MRFGVCSSIENIKLIEEAGFDYIEPTVTAIEALSEEEYGKVKSSVDQSGIKAEVFNVFVPGSMRLVGGEVDYAAIRSYLERAIERVRRLGAEIIVFGSGHARKVPEGFPMQKAREQLVEFLTIAAGIAKPYGITIVIEPLPVRSCNIINNVLEGLELAETVNLPNVKLLADYWHMLYDRENIENIVEAGGYIRHIHINNPDGGLFPKLTDATDYSELMMPLYKIGYNERISIEAFTSDLKQDLIDSMALWRKICKGV